MIHKDVYTNCLAFQITQARKKVLSWYEPYLKPLGLTPPYVYVLGVLKDVERATPSEIAVLLGLERPTVTTLLNRMERDGLIERHINPNNRRETLVGLSVQGVDACDKAYPRLIDADRALNQLLEGDFELLKSIVSKLNEVLKGDHND